MGTGDPQKEPLGTEANDEEALWALEGRVVRWHLSRLELYSPPHSQLTVLLPVPKDTKRP